MTMQFDIFVIAGLLKAIFCTSSESVTQVLHASIDIADSLF